MYWNITISKLKGGQVCSCYKPRGWSLFGRGLALKPKHRKPPNSEAVRDPSHITMISFLLLTLTIAASASRVPRNCGTCNPSMCEPLPAEGCASGALFDACGCCASCASGVGEPCGGRGAGAKRCASGLECVKSEKKSKAGVCVCKNDYPVCGSDGLNYRTGCDLRATSVKAVREKKPEIKIQNKGKCAQGEMCVNLI